MAKKQDFVMRELKRLAKKTSKELRKIHPPVNQPTEDEMEEMARAYNEEDEAELLMKDTLAERGGSPF